jgi:hypothetical protein
MAVSGAFIMDRYGVVRFKGTIPFEGEGTDEVLILFVGPDEKEFMIHMPIPIAADVIGGIEAALKLLETGGQPIPRPKPPERVIRYDAVPSPDEPDEVIVTLRMAEIYRVLVDRGGPPLPCDDAGRDDIRLLFQTLSTSGKAAGRMTGVARTWAPWMPADELASLIADVVAKPRRFKATPSRCGLGSQRKRARG